MKTLYQETYNTIEQALERELWDALNDAEMLGKLTSDQMCDMWAEKSKGFKWLNENPSVCDTAPFPLCNGAQGCDRCEHQKEES